MAKYKIGDKVGIIKGYWIGKIGVIIEINEDFKCLIEH